MFWHNFKYRIKISVLAKEELFWMMAFPIILCTCFYIAFSGIFDKVSVFHSIPVAVVYEEDNEAFKQVLSSVSESDYEGENFLYIREEDADTATKLLEDGDVDAIITVADEPRLTVNKSDINQTAVQTFLNNYLQQQQLYISLFDNSGNIDPEQITMLTAALNDSVEYIKESSFTDSTIDNMTSYYYALIGMAVLFGGFMGMQVASQMNADASPEGLRKCIIPVRRIKIIFSEYLAAVLMHFTSLVILLAYMILVLGIEFGNQLGYVSLVCVVGSVFGVSFGVFLGSIPRLKEGIRNAIFILFSLGSSFLSGLMAHPVKIMIQQNAPIVNRLNPGTLIQDALYSLLLYESHTRYYQNLITLCVMAAVFFLISFLVTRREKYASL